MSKSERQRLIIEFIESTPVDRQEDIAEYLIRKGVPVTQATVSRDIRNIGLIKQNVGGVLRYVAPTSAISGDTSQKLGEVFANCVLTVDRAKNIVVLKTLSGMAQAAASAIDNLHSTSGIVGCIAGDDTIMVVMRTDEDAVLIQNKFMKMKK